MSILVKTAVAAGLLLPVAALTAPAQAADAVSCGATISGPVTLTHDLSCHGDGVTLLAGTLNLHGHTLRGDGTGTGVIVGDQSDVAPTVHAAVVGGTVTGFGTGIASPGNDVLYLSLSRLTISHTTDAAVDDVGIASDTMDHVVVADNAGLIANQLEGMSLVVTHSMLKHNGGGIVLDSDGSLNVANTIYTDNGGINCSEARLTITHSAFVHNASGINLFECEGSTLTDSAFLDDGSAAVTEVEGFDIYANPTLTVRHDLFQGNGIGLHLGIHAMAVSVLDSTFRSNGAGIVMDGCTVANECTVPISDEFVDNVFTRNKGNGVTWGFGTLALSRNHFADNGGWGFYGTGPDVKVVDGGKNMAHGNHLGNCLGLTCH